jgi:quercetin dioxygenase-like cupin family protein
MSKTINEDYAFSPAADNKIVPFDWGSLRFLLDSSDGASQHASMLIATIKSGTSNMRHRHPNCDELLYLLKGHIRHAAGPAWVEMKPGDTIRIARNVPHQAQVIGPEDAVMVVVYSTGLRETVAVED